MVVVAVTMRFLNALGVAGCTDRQKLDDAEMVLEAAELLEDAESFKRPATLQETTSSTCTPTSTPGCSSLSMVEVSSTLSFGSACRLNIPLPRGGVSRLTPGHWLLRYEGAAYDPLDLELLAIFLDSTKVSSSVTGQKHAMLLVKMMRFLHSLGLGFDEICCHLAHASIYFRSIYSACGAAMNSDEVANVLLLLVFLAHCYIQDETCQLHVWHQYLFKRYCKLPVLNKATVQLMKRLNFVLRVSDLDFRLRLTELSQVMLAHSEEKEPVGFGAM